MRILTRSTLSLLALSFFLVGCGTNSETKIEEAQFLLDEGDFAGAEQKARELLQSDPDNNDGKFILASALLGSSILGGGNTYLTLVADIQRSQGSGSSLDTFTGIASGLTDAQRSDLEEARDTLLDIPVSYRDANREVWLQLYVARLFEISAAVDAIGANNDDDECNANPANPNTDGIPDGYDPNALDDTESARFNDNMDNVDSDGDRAGLPSDFSITELVGDLFDRLETSIASQGNDVAAGLAEFFKDEFGDPDNEALCTL